MLRANHRLALYMEGNLDGDYGKMGFGILRYSPQEIVCVVDSSHAGKQVSDVADVPRSCPVVGSIRVAWTRGADVLVLGIAPPGGRIPESWLPAIQEALSHGMSVVNGLHELLAPRFRNLRAGQFVWDIRTEPEGLGVGSAKAASLDNTRVLMIGTDMAVGKMTAGLEIWRAARGAGVAAEFVATGQIGIAIMGSGVPLDAIRVDYACAAIEREVLRASETGRLVIVEGQGALLHPGSTSTLPLLRGACPTHLVLCHRLGMKVLRRHPSIAVPPIPAYVKLYEDLAEVVGTYPRPRTVGMCVNTSHEPDEGAARDGLRRLEDETGLPCTDPVRFGATECLGWLKLPDGDRP
ncbi:MAG: DUF1611 domain-containing protein [Fimbriimonadaceae bacterium]|nr:DUF1611 domain-containing protein [Fimbriimonadaceae bacterium]